MKAKHAAISGALACLSACTGCATTTRHPLLAWKQEVTHFIAVDGKGDPSVLRDTVDMHSRRGPRPAPITFSALGSQTWRSRDARGVLVGVHQVNRRPWYVFLVATIQHHGRERSELEDVRLIAFTSDADGVHWLTTARSPESLSQYLQSSGRQQRWLKTRYAPFPALKDAFSLQAAGEHVTVIERNSRARWEADLPIDLHPATNSPTDSALASAKD